jgi:hypothetical protein
MCASENERLFLHEAAELVRRRLDGKVQNVLRDSRGGDPVTRWDPMGLDWVFYASGVDEGGNLTDFEYEWDGKNGPEPATGPHGVVVKNAELILRNEINNDPGADEYFTNPIPTWYASKARVLMRMQRNRAAKVAQINDAIEEKNRTRWGGSITYEGQTYSYAGKTEEEWQQITMEWYLRHAEDEARRLYIEEHGVAPSGATFGENVDQLFSDPRVALYAFKQIAPLVQLPSSMDELKQDVAIAGLTLGTAYIAGRIIRGLARTAKAGRALDATGDAIALRKRTQSGHIGIPRVRKPVNLPSWRKVGIDLDHVLSGHMRGGNRVSSLKTLFPADMTRGNIASEIRSAYRNAKRLKTQGPRVLVRGRGKRLELEMWVNLDERIIETAYPVR